MNSLSFQLTVHNYEQVLTLADNICKAYFGEDTKYTFETTARLTDPETGKFTVDVLAEIQEYIIGGGGA